jgi:hypothetical protein
MDVVGSMDEGALEPLVARCWWLLRVRLLSWPGGVAGQRRWCGWRIRQGPQRPLDFDEDRVGFGEGTEVFGPVVAGEFVVCGLVEADADVSVGLAGGVFDFVFGEEAVGAGGLVAAPVDSSPLEGLEVLVAVDVARRRAKRCGR